VLLVIEVVPSIRCVVASFEFSLVDEERV